LSRRAYTRRWNLAPLRGYDSREAAEDLSVGRSPTFSFLGHFVNGTNGTYWTDETAFPVKSHHKKSTALAVLFLFRQYQLPALLGSYAILDSVLRVGFVEHRGHLIALAIMALRHVTAASGLRDYCVVHGDILFLRLHAVGFEHL
jgi:hypothetical protein